MEAIKVMSGQFLTVGADGWRSRRKRKKLTNNQTEVKQTEPAAVTETR